MGKTKKTEIIRKNGKSRVPLMKTEFETNFSMEGEPEKKR